MALAALQQGGGYVEVQIAGLQANREAVADALSPLGELGDGVAGGEGAIYYWGRLPPGCEDDEAVVEWLIREHGVCVIPGSSCGGPGYIRVAYANLSEQQCREAAARLKQGLQQLVAGQGPLSAGS
jgi:aspartate/methionine/tyrosine aminotransferase